jgi:hypothetical protein
LLAGQSLVHQFRYDDRWYPQTDGGGRSLEAIQPARGDLQNWGLKRNWAPSSRLGGTPGYAGATPDFNADTVVDAVDIDSLFAQIASAPSKSSTTN